MKLKRLRSWMQPALRWSGLYFALLPLAACGDEEAADDPTEFTVMNIDKIEYDCTQFLQCRSTQADTTTTMAQYDTCVRDKSANLRSNATGQWQFLADFARCGTNTACSYTECADLHTKSYGLTQFGKLTYECQQKLQCEGYSGDLATAQRLCETQRLLEVDVYTTGQKSVFEAEFSQCSAMFGCAFMTCIVP